MARQWKTLAVILNGIEPGNDLHDELMVFVALREKGIEYKVGRLRDGCGRAVQVRVENYERVLEYYLAYREENGLNRFMPCRQSCNP